MEGSCWIWLIPGQARTLRLMWASSRSDLVKKIIGIWWQWMHWSKWMQMVKMTTLKCVRIICDIVSDATDVLIAWWWEWEHSDTLNLIIRPSLWNRSEVHLWVQMSRLLMTSDPESRTHSNLRDGPEITNWEGLRRDFPKVLNLILCVVWV